MKKKMTIVKINSSEVATMVNLANVAMTFGIGFSYVPYDANDKDIMCFSATKTQLLLDIKDEIKNFVCIPQDTINNLYFFVKVNAEEVDGEISLSYSQTINLL